VSAELQNTWTRFQAELATAVGEPAYGIWLAPLAAVAVEDSVLVLEAPAHARRWIHDRYGGVLQTAAQAVLGPQGTVQLLCSEQPGAEPASRPGASGRPRSSGTRRGAVRQSRSPASSLAHEHGAAAGEPGPLGNPKLNFDQFVIGDSNRLAHAAALTVAEMPAQAYNPLFICGPPGVGKTHLLSSIANLVLSHNPGLTVRIATGEAFTNAFLAALADGSIDLFKDRFRHVDVLLMDDVQFLERKARTEEEFFHTFNSIYDGGGQIVLSSDRPPADLQALEDRLRERFAAGLVADIQAPDMQTRLAILRKRVHHDDIALHDERALALIAERVTSNVRALEGALIRVVAFSSLTGRQLTPQLTAEVLDGLYPRASPRPGSTIGEIQSAACTVFGLTPEELLSSARTPRIAWPRQVAMYLARELTGASLPAIGREFGGRDHTTVLHACRRACKRIASDADDQQAVEKLCNALGVPLP